MLGRLCLPCVPATPSLQDCAANDGDVPAAYVRLTEDPDPAVREKATDDWCAWEDATMSPETKGAGAAVFGGTEPERRLALVRIEDARHLGNERRLKSSWARSTGSQAVAASG